MTRRFINYNGKRIENLILDDQAYSPFTELDQNFPNIEAIEIHCTDGFSYFYDKGEVFDHDEG